MAKFSSKHAYTYDDVLIRPQYSEVNSRKDVDTSVEIASGVTLKTPVMSANMQSVNSVELCVALDRVGGMATIDQFRDIEKQVAMLLEVKKLDSKVAGAIGATKDFLERAEALIKNGVDLIVMDTPHAHSILGIEAIKSFRKKFKDFPLIAGNIATSEAVFDLAKAGVDGVKVGIGPGGACTTRTNAGVGNPQLSAVMECYEVAKNNNISVIADGGIKTAGNFSKAIAAGGTAAYIGSMFAGTEESPSELIEQNGKKLKKYYGSSSVTAKIERAQNDKNYNEKSSQFVEGAEGYTKYQGTVEELVEKLAMGLRSAMSYSGAFNISDFHDKAQFLLVTPIGIAENGAHGLVM